MVVATITHKHVHGGVRTKRTGADSHEFFYEISCRCGADLGWGRGSTSTKALTDAHRIYDKHVASAA